MKTIVLGGGCFWCLDPVFRKLSGIEKVIVGYAGGETDNPTYRDICRGATGHAEVLQITYNPVVISLQKMFEVFFTMHDPTTLNRQGADKGTQYRSIILYENNEDMIIANQIIQGLEDSGAYADSIVTEVVPLQEFFLAEDYHQDYFNKNPEKSYCQIAIALKMEKFKSVFENQD